MPASLVEVEGVEVHFGGLVAVDGVSFSVNQGEVVGLIGPNGAGKTTVLNVISGFLAPNRGRVFLLGTNVTRWPPWKLACHGMARTFQVTSVFPSLTVLDNVLTARHIKRRSTLWDWITGRGYRPEDYEAAHRILREVGLAHRRDEVARSLPYGDQRRLEIAIALATEPSVLLLDEPAAGMNPQEAEELVSVILRLRERGLGILLVEHNMRVVTRVCDLIHVMHRGRLIASGAPEDVVRMPAVIEVYLGGRQHAAG